eukprot:GEMP01000927.1.p1 GENE.GEMP01000927.1~~GEMP01000927.1.p1  ORF type:complete len:1187 (+),score=245.23 GEMP01000927.1:272-3832(+)
MADDRRKNPAMRQAFARVHPTPRTVSGRRDMPAPPSSRKDFAARECRHAARKESHVTGRGLPNTYLQLRQLGKGGFARVYEMLDKTTGKNVAVKVVQKAHVKKANAESKLRSEIEIHKSLEHSSVVRFLQSYEDAENAYLILELCPNQTLSEYLRAKPRRVISSPEAVYFANDLLAGLFYLRENMIIHRDLKLSNLFLDADFHIKIGDFGLAAQLKDSHDVRHTLCGTPNYIAPEILDVQAGHSFEVDLWSFGVIVYTLLVGRPPFETNNLRTTYRRIRQMEYSFPDTVPTDAKEMIVGVLQSNVNIRWTLDDILHCAWMNQPSVPPKVPGITTTFSSAGSLDRDPPRTTNRPASVEPKSSRGHRPAVNFRTVSTDPRRLAPAVRAPRTLTTPPVDGPPRSTTPGSIPLRTRVTPRGRNPCGDNGPTPRVSARNTTNSRPDGTPVRSKSRDVSPRVEAFQLYDAQMLHQNNNLTGRGISKAPTPRTIKTPASGQCRRAHPVSQRERCVEETIRDKKNEHTTGVTHDIRCFFNRATPASHQVVRSATMKHTHNHHDQKTATYSRPLSARLLRQSISPHGRLNVSPKNVPCSADFSEKRAQNQFTQQSNASSTRASSSHASQYRVSVLAQKRRDNSISRATSGRTDISPSPSCAHLTSCAPQDETLPAQSGGATASAQHQDDACAKQKSGASFRSLIPAGCAMTSAPQHSDMGAKQISDASLRSLRPTEAARSSTTRTFGRHGSLETVAVEPLRLDKIMGDLRTMGPDTRTTETVRAMETVRIQLYPSSSSSHNPTTVVTPVASVDNRKYNSRICTTTSITKPHAANGGAVSCARTKSPMTPITQQQRPSSSYPRPRPITPHSSAKDAVTPSQHPVSADSKTPTPKRAPFTKPVSTCAQGCSTAALPVTTKDAPWTRAAQRLPFATTDAFGQPRSDENAVIAARPISGQVFPQVVKWVDYSSKYGLATLMSDYSINVQFNDKSHVIASSSENVTKFHYITCNQKTPDVHSTYLFSSHPQELQKKVTLFAYFRSTLLAPAPLEDKFNLEGKSSLPVCCANGPYFSSSAQTEEPRLSRKFVATPQNAQNACRRKQLWSTDERGPETETTQMPYVQKWLKNGQAIVFLLSNRSVQIVFSDKTELLLDEERKLLRYVNARRKYRTYRSDECQENQELKQRVLYARNLISTSM